MKVSDPVGQTWRVSRRWVPWRRKLKGALGSIPDLGIGGGSDPVSAVIGIIALVVAIPFVLLALVAGLELLLLLLLLPFALLGRVVLGRHWTVEVRRGWRPWWEQEAGSWQASGLRIHEVADEVRRGTTPPRTIDRPPLPEAPPGPSSTA